MLVIVSASMWMPLASRSPRAASETACWKRSRSVMSSSIVSVPAIERSEPSRTFFTMVSIWLSGSPMNRSAAARRRSGSRAILNIAWPVMSTPTPCFVTAWFSWVSPISTCRAVSCSRPTLLRSGQTKVPAPTTTLTPWSCALVRVPFSSRILLPRAPEITSASFAPATRYRCAAKSASRMITPIVARTSCVTVSVMVIPFFLHAFAASRSSRRREAANRDAHAVHAEDLDVPTERDDYVGLRGKGLHGTVVGQRDHAARLRGDAHDHARTPADKLAQASRLGSFGATQDGEDREGEPSPHAPEN